MDKRIYLYLTLVNILYWGLMGWFTYQFSL